MKKLILLFFFVSIAFSQTENLQITNWKNYTSYNKINVLSAIGEFIWAGTDGGAFSYNHSTKEIFKLTNVEGLSNLEITAILSDDKGRVWFGGANGLIDIYNTETGKWVYNRDVFLSQSGQNKRINNFVQKGDSVYILTDFGISIFDTKINEYKDTYIKLGDFTAFSPVKNMTMHGGKIVALTPSGIAMSDQNNTNLILPTEWVTFSANEHFGNNTLIDITYFNNILFVLTERALYKFENNQFVKTSDIYYNPKKMVTHGSLLYVITDNKIMKLNTYHILEDTQFDSPLESTFAIFNNNVLYIGSNQGFYVLNNEKIETIDLNCPYSNFFFDMMLSSTGELWAVSVGLHDVKSYGFYNHSKGEWKNYNVAAYPVLATNVYCSLGEGPDGAIYVGSWGRGVAKLKDGNITMINETNSKLIGVGNPSSGQPHYIPIGAVTRDRDGTMWFTNHLAMDGSGLVSMDKNGAWKGYINTTLSTSSLYYRQMIIDEYSSKWIISDWGERRGLLFYNEKYTLPNTVNGWGFVSNNDLSLGTSTDAQVLCMVQDRNNELWVGTRDGIAVINVISNPLSRITRPCFTTRCNISGQSVNCIKVDALNNKWLGTSSTGIWILSSDGSYVITQLNTENSPLLSNDIKCITFNPADGTVYVGTEKGLSTFKTFLVEPLPEYTENLKVYPNPYKPEMGNVYIDGLIEGSNIKVISPYGKLITEFQSPGGRVAVWNGKDYNNEFVASGVYFIVAYSNDGSKTSIGKVAVVRSGK